jgi:hypothetical protein
VKSPDLPKEEVIKCFHCGNETLMRQTGEFQWGSRDIEYDDLNFNYTYEMFACPVCHKVTLRETYGDETMMEYGPSGETEWYSKKSILFPINSIDSGSIPPKVKEAFEAALKTKCIDKNICLMALRRTLELILKDKGATKWGLKDKIEEIAEKGLLPDTLKEASSLTKILGDSAAHDKDLEINQHDVESMAEFIEFIIEYLYIVPDKINTYKERFSSKTDK